MTAINTNSNGTTTVFYEPFDFEQDADIVGPAGQVNQTTKGLDIVVKQNGIVTIDTANNIGMAQEKDMKLRLYPFLLSGYLNFDNRGYVGSVDGDLPFSDHWQGNLKYSIGFFQIVFSTNAIPTDGSWTNYIVLNNLNAFYLDQPIIQTNIFTRGPDLTTNRVAFAMRQSSESENVTAYIEQSGQRTSVAIPDCVMTKDATYVFDTQLGQLVSATDKEKIETTTSIVSPTGSATRQDDVEHEDSISLVLP